MATAFSDIIDAVEAKMRTQSGERPDRQGKVTIRLADNKKKDMLTISVTDNGGGIPEKTLAHVFDPFFTTKDEGMGTGLGLSISHGIVQAMGGELAVANTRDGTRFTLTLPVLNDMFQRDIELLQQRTGHQFRIRAFTTDNAWPVQ